LTRSATTPLRFPRERFTRTLSRLLTRLDSQGIVEFDVLDSSRSSLPTVAGNARGRVLRVWIFGSYARGALTCGDLDLIAEIATEWVGVPTLGGRPAPQMRGPEFRQARRSLLGSLPHVEIFERAWVESVEKGHASEGLSATVSMTNAIQIYGDGIDWRAAIAAIVPVDDAGHHPRAHDCLPLRLTQTGMDLRAAELLVEQHAAGLLTWEFAEIRQRETADSPQLTPAERAWLKRRFRSCGQKAREVLPGALIALRSLRAQAAWDLVEPHVNKHSIDLRIGAGCVDLRTFGSLKVRAIALVPHWSARGPNGVWIVRRGAQHRHVLAMKDASAFVNWPPFVTDDGDGSMLAVQYDCVELYSSRASAADNSADGGEDATPEIRELTGTALLDVIIGADVVEVDQIVYATGIAHPVEKGVYGEPMSPAVLEDVLEALTRVRRRAGT
jgi:hypothetical protein